MKILKHISAGLLMLAVSIAMANMALDAAIYEVESAPRPPIEYLNNLCSQGNQDACEAYYDRVNAGDAK